MAGVHYPRKIRLAPEQYANGEACFHFAVHAHPGVVQFPSAVCQAVWAEVISPESRKRVRIHAACLMPDHLHLLVSPAELDALTFLGRLKSWTTRVAWAAGHRGLLWQPSAWDRAVRDRAEFDEAVEYIVHNPVAANLVETATEWPFVWAWYMDEAVQEDG